MVEDWTGVIFGMGVLILSTVVIVTVLLIGNSFAQFRIGRREQGELEGLVQRYEELVTRLADQQGAASTDLADMRSRVAEIERILHEVG